MLGILNSLKSNRSDYYLGWVEDDGELILPFLRTSPHLWVLPELEHPLVEEAVQTAVHFMYVQGYELPGVTGPNKHAAIFKDEWERLTKNTASIHMQQIIYQLDEVQINVPQSGKMVLVKQKDIPLLINWLQLFGEQANVSISFEHAKKLAEKMVSEEGAIFWKVNEQNVSMANRSRTTKHGATINGVFTPDEFKRNGYATNVVAALSQKLLDDGYQFCTLYTDVSNPTSNGIYRRIGYYEVGSSIVYHF